MKNDISLKYCFGKWAILGLFFVFFGIFKQTIQIFEHIIVLYSNSQPADYESPRLTARPRLPPIF